MPVAPGRMSSSAVAMKMCNISVAPMPSISRMPVAASTSRKVCFGRVSPAETPRRSELRSTDSASSSSLR